MDDIQTPPVLAAQEQSAFSDLGPDAVSGVVLKHLLAMANQYLVERKVHQAIELYLELIEEHAGTAQAAEAKKALLEIAVGYEREGMSHAARSLYQRLL